MDRSKALDICEQTKSGALAPLLTAITNPAIKTGGDKSC